MKVDEAELRKLQTEVVRAHGALVHGVSILNATTTAPSGVERLLLGSSETPFGNTGGGKACHAAHSATYTQGTASMSAFAGTVDADAERMKMAIALYLIMEDANAESMLLLKGKTLDFLSAHMSLAGDNATEQAAQIEKLRGLVADIRDGNVLVGGDLNAAMNGNDPSARAIQRFGWDGYDTHAGTINDGPNGAPKGTSQSYHPIDHVLPRGVGTAPATRWDRGQSDHDGQRVDVTMPNW
ncbi:endonuclease/exonuclease/phosphatase family protein [Nocardia sp. NPDC127579]|uniref:endonuclease/exonuclease/phosphatase family protein n=1 Tax=Nocardia sp. NPDC127579 TaxID=3345402 RepID=UPI0036351341